MIQIHSFLVVILIALLTQECGALRDPVVSRLARWDVDRHHEVRRVTWRENK